MTSIVLRVRLTGGDHIDVTHDLPDARSEADVVEHAVTTLGQEGGVLRCEHGGRLVFLFARGVAMVEVAPRGAVL